MNCEVYNRFKEVIPVKRLDEMSSDEVIQSVNVAFKIIGHESDNIEESVEKAWESSTALSLFEFVYDVYEVDVNGC